MESIILVTLGGIGAQPEFACIIATVGREGDESCSEALVTPRYFGQGLELGMLVRAVYLDLETGRSG